MILPIVLYGNDILRKKNKDVLLEEDFSILINDMFETMYNANGIGLAAPQIGKNINLFVADIGSFGENEYNKKKIIAINPVLEFPKENEIIEDIEGCLSIPNIGGNVRRYKTVKIKYYDEKKKYKEEEYHDWAARVIQHETDHLCQKLYIDYLQANKDLTNALEKIKKGEIVPTYDFTKR